MNTKYNNMNQPDDFQKFGKRLPYQEPDGFFEGFSECTLETAKQRTQRSLTVVWKTLAVAASIAAVVILGHLIQEKELPPTTSAVDTNTIEVPAIQDSKKDNMQTPVVAEWKKENSQDKVFVPENEENVNDVLADLSDEELMQMAAMFEADLFTEESNLNN